MPLLEAQQTAIEYDSQLFESTDTFSDELDALQALEDETRRTKVKDRVVVQHRTWQISDVFRSEPGDIPSSPIQMATMASSPPISPSGKKRTLDNIDLGHSTLSRPAKAQRIYYGLDIHSLLKEAQAEDEMPRAPIELPTPPAEQLSSKPALLWTEKYRAKKFTDLIGDERTHRSVMHWLKRWDQTVFPGSYRPKKPKGNAEQGFEDKAHRKILLLTGPPGLGKTTLAHVCAKQAGYEVQEINASDERSRDVVKGRIRDMVGTENVKGVDTKTTNGKVRKAGRPVCVIVDEVDGVVSGSGGGGEGGFVKALIDLVMLDQKNSGLAPMSQAPAKKKGDRFRLLRPLILICNDVYHPSLRPLRQSSIAEVIHVRKPPLQTIVLRMQNIFEKEGIPCDSDGVRRLCEAAWGVSNRKEDRTGNGAGEGDMRGIMVVGEWVAGKLRAMDEITGGARLSRKWIEDNILSDLSHGGGGARGLGRGGPKDIVERVFREGAGFPKSTNTETPQQQQVHSGSSGVKGVAESLKRTATQRLRELIDTHGDTDRIMTDAFSAYPTHPFQDDTYLSKPDAAYEWLHFHDTLSSAVFKSSEWELAPYLSTPVLGFHHLFASQTRSWAQQDQNPADDAETAPHPFTTASAPWAASEAQKANTATLQTLHSALSPSLTRSFTSPADLSTELLPYLLRMLSPAVNPTVIGGSNSTAAVRKASEQVLLARAVQAMCASGVRFEKTKVSSDDGSFGGNSSWIYRMEPAVDTLGAFETGGKGFGSLTAAGRTRYAVRQVLDQEFRKEEQRRAELARMARLRGSEGLDEAALRAAPQLKRGRSAPEAETGPNGKKVKVVRDFFGRAVEKEVETLGDEQARKRKAVGLKGEGEERRVWVTFHEGFSNAVRKPLTLAELMRDM